jgi:hypothetical protein
MADIKIIIPRDSFKNLSQSYKDFAEYTRQSIKDVLLEEGALTSREAMVYTAPMEGNGGGQGLNKIAEKWGNWAIERDVHSFVTPKNKILQLNLNTQSEFVKWKNTVNPNLDKGDTIIAKIRRDANVKRAYQAAKNLMGNNHNNKFEVLATEAQIKAKHDALRVQFKGRIRKNRGPMLPQPFIGDEKVISAYIKKRQEKVGWMKSGWYDCIKKIPKPTINGIEKNFGIKGLNQFVTRHTNNSGMTKLDVGAGSDGKIFFTVTNLMGNILNVADINRTEIKVIQAREGKMFRRIQHFNRAAIDKTNKGMRLS